MFGERTDQTLNAVRSIMAVYRRDKEFPLGFQQITRLFKGIIALLLLSLQHRLTFDQATQNIEKRPLIGEDHNKTTMRFEDTAHFGNSNDRIKKMFHTAETGHIIEK